MTLRDHLDRIIERDLVGTYEAEVRETEAIVDLVVDGVQLDAPREPMNESVRRFSMPADLKLDSADPPDADALEDAIQAERQSGFKPPAGRGNHRTGPVRIANQGHVTPADQDPIVLQRRTLAMPLWNHGYTAEEVRSAVNLWLEQQGLPPVSISTIRNDKGAIVSDWEADYDASSAINRAQHISSLNRIKSEAWEQYSKIRDEPTGKKSGSAAVFLKIAMQAETELATLDGSKTRAEVQAAAQARDDSANTIIRVYKGVDLDQV